MRELRRNVKFLVEAVDDESPSLQKLIDARNTSERVLDYLYTQHPSEHPDESIERELLSAGRTCAAVSSWFSLNAERPEIQLEALTRLGCDRESQWVISNETYSTDGAWCEILAKIVLYTASRDEWLAPEPVWREIRTPGSGEWHVGRRELIDTASRESLCRLPLVERCHALEALMQQSGPAEQEDPDEREWLSDTKWWCVDCQIHTGAVGDYYMVQDDMWETHGVGDGMLCLVCLEKRVGRELKADDFTEALVNKGALTFRSELMRQRVESQTSSRS